ncbi:MAG TPA: hypothetical protein VM890_16895 [Longimicrobium sp.]|jgi:hypothetical protein|nr:hypothetical protein [Longimicrobium sp.]
MVKLKLDVDALRVESFAAGEEQGGAKGTVRANSWYVTVNPYVNACSEPASQNCQETDFHWNTCGNSCVNMCFATGNDPACID